MKKLLSTKEVAHLLGVNEKKVYSLITESGLPATKITGKWVFPEDLVEKWVASKTVNYPEAALQPPLTSGLLVVAGSNDMLFDRALDVFMKHNLEMIGVFGNVGSLGGLNALRKGLCQIATSHLPEENGDEFNFSYAADELKKMPIVVNFCRRRRGFILPAGNPRQVSGVRDIAAKGLRVVNRPLGSSTRLVFDRELRREGLDPEKITGYEHEVARHYDVGFEILAGRADLGPAIQAVAKVLGLSFLPLSWERFDLIIPKENFFLKEVQVFLEMLRSPDFGALADELSGYDLSLSGKVIYPLKS